jgi:hypothetical protein
LAILKFAAIRLLKGRIMEPNEIERKRIQDKLTTFLSDLTLQQLEIYDETLEALAELPFKKLRLIPAVLYAVVLRQSAVRRNLRRTIHRRQDRIRISPRRLQAYGLADKAATRETNSDVAAHLG